MGEECSKRKRPHGIAPDRDWSWSNSGEFIPSRIDPDTAWRLFKERKPTGDEIEFSNLFRLHGLPLWCDDYKVDSFRLDITVEADHVTIGPTLGFGAFSKPVDAYKWQTHRKTLLHLLERVGKLGAHEAADTAVISNRRQRGRPKKSSATAVKAAEAAMRQETPTVHPSQTKIAKRLHISRRTVSRRKNAKK